jgi:hypothetical protein
MQQLHELYVHGVLQLDAAALAGLQQMPHLRSLDILAANESGAGFHALGGSSSSSVAAMLLLPLSVHLTCLKLTWHDEAGCLLHQGWAQQMFAAGRQLPQLKQLVLGMSPQLHSHNYDEEYAPDFDEYDPTKFNSFFNSLPACFGSSDIAGLVQCCPNLEDLCIAGLVQQGVNFSPLLQLTALTQLYLGGGAVDDGVAYSSLGVVRAYGLTEQGLHWLAFLQQLTRLIIDGGGCGWFLCYDKDYSSQEVS